MPSAQRPPQRAGALRPQLQLQTPKRDYHTGNGEKGIWASPKVQARPIYSKKSGEKQPLSASDDDLQQEIARARKRAVPSTSDVTPTPARRPSSAVNTKASASPPQPHPRGGEQVARQALLVPPKPNGVLLGRTPSHSGATSRSNSSVAPLGAPVTKAGADEGGTGRPKQRMGSPVSAPMRINEQRKGVEDGSKRVLPSTPRGAETKGDGRGKGVPMQAPLPPRSSHPPSRALQKDRTRLPPPQLGDEVPTPPRNLHVLDQSDEKDSTLSQTPGTRQQRQWMEVLNYVDAITIAVTHRARVAPPVSQEVGEAWGETIAPGASPRDALVGGGVPLSLGGLGPSARSPRSMGLKSIHDLQRSVGGLLHWFGLLELRSMPDGTSVRDADRNLQMLGQDVLRHLGQVNQSLLEAAARRGTQSLNFVKAQSHPSFEDCVHSINRMLSDGKGIAAIRDVVARRDVDKARAIVSEHKASLTAATSSQIPKSSLSSKTGLARQASPGAVKASPTSKFQRKRSMPLSSSPQQGTRGQNSTVGHANKGHEVCADKVAKSTFDPSRPTYPPTLVDWLERQWLPAAEEWGEILKTAQNTFASPIATRESITKYMDSVQADINARQAAFQEMLLPGESLPRLVQSLIVSPGTEAARIAGKREEKFGRLKAAISKCDFVDLSAKLKEVRDVFPDETVLSELEVNAVREGQRLLLNMQHVAKVTMGLTQALGASSPTVSASASSDPGLFVRAADVRPLLKAITAANQTLLDLKLASESQKCELAVDRGCALLVQLENLEQGSSTVDVASPTKWLAFYRSISAAELVVAHVPGGAWPPELTLLYQRAVAALGTVVEREIARHDVKRQLQKHLVPLPSHSQTNLRGSEGQGLASDIKSPLPSNAKAKTNNPVRSSTPAAGEVNGRARATPSREEGRVVSRGHRGGSTSTEMITDFSPDDTRASASPAPVDATNSHRPSVTTTSHEGSRGVSTISNYSGTGTVAIEDLRVLISRGRQLGLGEGPEIQQLQRVLESATELRLKIHFDSNIRVLGLPLERVVADATTSASGGLDNAPAEYASPSSRPTPRQSRPRYEPPSFEKAFDRIYRFCTIIPTPSQSVPTTSGLGVGQRASYGSAFPSSPLLKTPSTTLSSGGLFTPLDTNFRIRYQDSDGDYITVASEEDWRVLLSDHYRGVLAGGGGEGGGGKTNGGLSRKIEIFCDIPPLPQHALPSNSNQSQQAAVTSSQGTVNDKGNYATPYRASPFIPSTMPLTAKAQTPTSVGSRGRGARGTEAVNVEGDEMGIRGRNLATGAANQSPSADAPLPSLSPPASATKRSGFTVQHASGAAATARHGQGSAQATRASIARPTSQPHPPPSRSPAPTQKVNEALNELMRRDRDPRHKNEQMSEVYPSHPPAKASAAPAITITATTADNENTNTTKRNSKSYLPAYGTGGGIGVGLGSASLRPSKTTDDDGTLSVIEVHSTNAGWGAQKRVGEGDGNCAHEGDDDGFDIRTMHSVATTAFTAEDREALLAHLAPQKEGGGGVPRKEKGWPLEAVHINNKALPLKPTTSALPNDKKTSPVDTHVVGASEERMPLTWQEAHGDDYDVNTIMSEETTVAIVRQREALREKGGTTGAVANAQSRQRSEAKGSPAMGKSPVATGASKKPLTTAELNQRRALLLAQLRKQRQTTSEGGVGVQESRRDLSVGAQKK